MNEKRTSIYDLLPAINVAVSFAFNIRKRNEI